MFKTTIRHFTDPSFLFLHTDLYNTQVPDILKSLQVSVQAVLLRSLSETDWIHHGVTNKSLVDSWPLASSFVQAIDRDSPAAAIATDSKFLYIHGSFGLLKIGSGYGSTKKVR